MTNRELVQSCMNCLKAPGDKDANISKLCAWAGNNGIDNDRLEKAFECAEFLNEKEIK